MNYNRKAGENQEKLKIEAIEDFLNLLKKVKKTKDGWIACCPSHDDKNPSLSISLDGPKILLHCFPGCSKENIVTSLGLQLKDLFLDSNKKEKITLNQLAIDKKIPESFLKELGLIQKNGLVLIPYKSEDGSLGVRNRIRTELSGTKGSLWDSAPGEIVPYGLWTLDEAQLFKEVFLVEGESDCWTFWYHNLYPCLGIPGCSMTGKLKPEHLKGIPKTYIIFEKDDGGKTFVRELQKRFKNIGWKGKAKVLTFPEGIKDVNELHRKHEKNFRKLMEVAISESILLDDFIKKLEEEERSKEDEENNISFCLPPPKIELKNELYPTPKKNEVNLDLSKINPVFESYYSNFANENECPKEYLLSAFLVSLGVMIGKNACLPKGLDWHYPNLYMLLIGKSTWSGKSTAMRGGLEVLKKINREREFRYSREKEEHDGLKDKDKDKIKPPVFDLLIYANDINLPSLLEDMAQKPDGLFALGEMGAFLAKMKSQHGDGLKEALTSMYDGETYRKKTQTKGVILVDNPRPSILGLSTVEWLQTHLQHSDLLSGFLGRFLYVVRNDYEDIDVPMEKPIHLDPAWEKLFMNMSREKLVLRKHKSIIELWEKYYSKTKHEKILSEGVVFHNPLGRILREAVDKIMIINHMLDYASGVVSYEKRHEIQEKSYHESIAWAEFFMENVKAGYEDLTSPVNFQETRILEKIRKHGEKSGLFIIIDRSELLRKTRMSSPELDLVIDTLVERREVQKFKIGRANYYKILD